MASKKFLTVSAAALLALSMAACGGDSDSDSASGGGDKEPLKVGTEGVYAPFSFHEEGSNELTGYDVEVAEAVGEKLGREVEFSEAPWDSLFAGLEAKRFDVIANQVTINPEREGKYTLSTPYTYSQGVIVTLASDTSITDEAGLKGRTAAQSATSNWADAAKAAGAKIEAVEGLTQSVALLKQKRVDVTLNDNLAVLEYLNTSKDTEVKISGTIGEVNQQAFALRKDSSDLATEIDTALKDLAADGTLAEISEKYFGTDVSVESSTEATPAPSAG